MNSAEESRVHCSSLPPASLDVSGMTRLQPRLASCSPEDWLSPSPPLFSPAQRCGRWLLLLQLGAHAGPWLLVRAWLPWCAPNPNLGTFSRCFPFHIYSEGDVPYWTLRSLCPFRNLASLPTWTMGFLPSGYLEESATKLNRLASNPGL